MRSGHARRRRCSRRSALAVERRRRGPRGVRRPRGSAPRRPGRRRRGRGPRRGAARTAGHRRGGCPPTPTSRSPAARATRCSTCSTPPGSRRRPGRPARRASRGRSHVLLAMGVDEVDARGALRFSLGHTVDRRRRRRAARGPAGRRRPGPGRRARDRRVGDLMRVLAALSGGVDSAVAAARAVDAGHDVVGVHMALSRTRDQFRTGSRGCCSIEDAGDARRAADVLGIPYYVWDLSERFEETVVADFVAEYEAGRTPNPCVRCNEHIKFATLLDKARRPRVRRRLHRPLRAHRDPRRRHPGAAPRPGPGQGPVVRARRDGPRAAGAVDVPARRRRLQGGGARRGGRPRAVRVRQAGLLRHLLRRRRRHPGLPALAARVAARARSSTAPARCSGSTTARTRSPSGSARACRSAGPAADGRPRYVLVGRAGEQPGGRRVRRRARGAGRRGGPRRLVRRRGRHRSRAPCRSARTAPRCPRGPPCATAVVEIVLDVVGALRGVAPGQSAVLYDGTRVLGQATVTAAQRATAGVAR